MNYLRIYNELTSQKDRSLDCYTEKHHIIPKCLGGSNDKCNIVRLTAREHFIAHWILTKIYPKNRKLKYAFSMMTCLKSHISSRQFERARLESHISHSGKNHNQFGKTRSAETKAKIRKSLLNLPSSEKEKIAKSVSKANKGRKMSDNTKQKLSAFNIGKTLSEEHKYKISVSSKLRGMSQSTMEKCHAANRGRKASEETKTKMSKSRLGKKMRTVVCPHCNKWGGIAQMKQWHFDNCKNK